MSIEAILAVELIPVRLFFLILRASAGERFRRRAIKAEFLFTFAGLFLVFFLGHALARLVVDHLKLSIALNPAEVRHAIALVIVPEVASTAVSRVALMNTLTVLVVHNVARFITLNPAEVGHAITFLKTIIISCATLSRLARREFALALLLVKYEARQAFVIALTVDMDTLAELLIEVCGGWALLNVALVMWLCLIIFHRNTLATDPI